MGGSDDGTSIWHSATSLRSDASASSAAGSNAETSKRARRFTSALPLRQRQIRSGFRPMKE
jgi:hypothetical protein